MGGLDADTVLEEIRPLLPAPRVNGEKAVIGGTVVETALGKAERMVLVRAWYLALPADARAWSSRALAEEPKYVAELEALTGLKAESVRTEYLYEIRRELRVAKS